MATGQPGASEAAAASPDDEGRLFLTPPAADDERGEQDAELAEAEEEAQIEAITEAAESGAAPDPGAERAALWRQEQELLGRMQAIAEQARHVPDAKTRRLIDWMREAMCPELPPFGRSPRGRPPRWNERRVLLFTENREGTKRYLRAILEQAIAGTDRADERIEVIDGLTQGARRKEIQRRSNAAPAADPLRILLATDAAREGLNFQAHCADLFHFDLPWNPGRIEQRNGRIDRKLQPAPEVRCHYFVLPQRVEDRVLEVLVRKTDTIKRELGSLSKVIDDDVERRLRGGIRHRDADRLKHAIEAADLDEVRRRITEEELEAARDRRDDLAAQVERCRGLLERSRSWVGFEAEPFRDALSCALELLGAEPLARDGGGNGGDPGQATWTFPALDRRTGADPTWAATLDTLRPPRRRDQKLADWRREAPIRPVAFEDAGVLGDDTVHLHLEQRVAQRLLARFRAQGFVHHDLSRACLAQARDSIPRVVLLGRLCLYGRRAERLHEEIVPLAARWVEPGRRSGPLRSYAREAETRTLQLLEQSLAGRPDWKPHDVIRTRLLSTAPRDVEELLPQLEPRAEEIAELATRRLRERGEREARDLEETLRRQRERIVEELDRHEGRFTQIALDFDEDERRQLQSNMRYWRTRLDQFDRDLKQEPGRIRAFYEVQAKRVEPVGLVYLWPETN